MCCHFVMYLLCFFLGLLLIFFCATKTDKIEFEDTADSGGILLKSNTEAPGEEVVSMIRKALPGTYLTLCLIYFNQGFFGFLVRIQVLLMSPQLSK